MGYINKGKKLIKNSLFKYTKVLVWYTRYKSRNIRLHIRQIEANVCKTYFQYFMNFHMTEKTARVNLVRKQHFQNNFYQLSSTF